MIKTCPICNNNFKTGRSDSSKIYCSLKCFGQSYAEKKDSRTCPECGDTFQSVKSRKTTFCSRKCSSRSRRKRVVKCCQFCGKDFETFPCKRTRRYCSFECLSLSKQKDVSGRRRCTKCGRTKRDGLFCGSSSWCRFCTISAVIKRRQTIDGRYKAASSLARRRCITFKLTKEEYSRIISKQCHYCGNDLPQIGVGIDRKTNTIGYVQDNCVPCCGRCNYVKGWQFTYEEMLLLSPVIKQIDRNRSQTLCLT